MRRFATLGVLILAGLLVASGAATLATEKLAQKEDVECTVCHKKAGGKKLTDKGKYYETLRTFNGYDKLTELNLSRIGEQTSFVVPITTSGGGGGTDRRNACRTRFRTRFLRCSSSIGRPCPYLQPRRMRRHHARRRRSSRRGLRGAGGGSCATSELRGCASERPCPLHARARGRAGRRARPRAARAPDKTINRRRRNRNR